MKSMRVWILLLLALLLPLRGVAAIGSLAAGGPAHCAAMTPTPPASPMRAATAAEPAPPAAGHASSPRHAQGASMADAGGCADASTPAACDAEDGGCATKTGSCAAGCCSALPMAAGRAFGLAAGASATAAFPPVHAPRVGFLTAGLDRPPRGC